jgi:hypothetical protein
MVTTIHDVHKLIREYYTIYGRYTVNEQDLTVRVDGHVILSKSRPDPGIVFSSITGDYGAFKKDLETLKGLPAQVGGALSLTYNLLTNLIGAPRRVLSNMDITHMQHSLRSLEGMPDHIQGVLYVTYDENLPLLRCLAANAVVLRQAEYTTAQLFEAQLKCEEILNDPKWIGKGKSHMLQCANSLKQAGLAGNARW